GFDDGVEQHPHRHTCRTAVPLFTLLVKVAGKDTASLVNALIPQVRRLPVTLRRSLTWDQDMEMAAHKHLTVATKV
ncbi:MAG: hypothetical protein KC643_29815, partial [Nitrospira sp.]|nr:hypothetical protein [Nitrospira sp.]